MIVPDAFFELCPRIESLMLSQNQIASIPRTLKLLTKLTELDLSCNRLTDNLGFTSEQEAGESFPRSLKVLNLAKN